MNWVLFAQLAVTVFVAFIGALLAHRLASKRDRSNARRDQRTAFLIDAYRKLEFAANRGALEDTAPVEKAIADIQLFGSKQQVQLAQDFAMEFAGTKTASLDILLQELRKDLRKELQLEEASSRLVFFRWIAGSSTKRKKEPTKS